jgi:hypothetical protein
VLVFLFDYNIGGYFIVIIDLRIVGITVVLILRLPLVLVYVSFASTTFPGLLLLLLFRWGLLLLLGHFLRFPACWILTLR